MIHMNKLDIKHQPRRRLNDYIDVGTHVEVILTDRNGNELARAKVDHCDVPIVAVCRWGVNSTSGTTQGTVNGKPIMMHVLLLGKLDGFVIDHINHDRYDNRRANLRHATKSQNGMNQPGAAGVFYINRPDLRKRWKMHLKAGDKEVYGYFLTREEALVARREAERQYFGEFAAARRA